ncbi:DNA/RNA non-specific endonuclease [Carboxylicivirga sp. A043]|uniref:DNA/RNA non-specific endonuclease n=1 Tax=Carboxylicivirga litoralis TaxID=2816963 RepID=UPI0021CB0529|nr:DNA/RNA non-specific endonuclease [Carboxylicivirga sp. A043]MCU4155974.1 DNA/RNA non-specific endonuclease [Carboxylicivirga sp. A043]
MQSAVKSYFKILSCLLVGSCMLLACSNNDSTSELTFELVPNPGEIPSSGGEYELHIKSNTAWTVEEDLNWLSVSTPYGEGDAIVRVDISVNKDEKRNAHIKISTSDKVDYLHIVQSSDDNTNNGNGGNTGLGDISKRIEIPELSSDNDAMFVAHTLEHESKKIANFSLEYVKSQRHARWVAFTYYNETAGNNVGRTDAWADDPQIPDEYRSVRQDFYGFDRGHIVASSDRVYCEEANRQTFYYSNMTPMYGNFNRYIWTKFEGAVRDWGRSTSFRDTLYVVKGGTLDKVIEYTTSDTHVPVPKYYYMALVNYKNKKYSGLAFWIEHRDNYNSGSIKVDEYAISIDELEAKTGINFFHNLPDNIEDDVEAHLIKSDWGGM